jgi:predicted hydrocarbon binding protein
MLASKTATRLNGKREDRKSCFSSLIEQAEYDKNKAEIRIVGTDWILIRSSTFRDMIEGTKKMLGSAAEEIWWEIAKHAGTEFARELLKAGTDPEEVPTWLETFFTHGGWGVVQSRIDLTKKEAVIRIENCATARRSKSNRPMCYFVSGFISGVAYAITNEDRNCSETKCIARGEPFCEFVVESSPDKEHLSI